VLVLERATGTTGGRYGELERDHEHWGMFQWRAGVAAGTKRVRRCRPPRSNATGKHALFNLAPKPKQTGLRRGVGPAMSFIRGAVRYNPRRA